MTTDLARLAMRMRNIALVSGQFMNPEFGLTAALERCLLGHAVQPATKATA